MQYTCVDCFILLEEDCWPASETWAQQWYEAAYNWGHITMPILEQLLLKVTV